MNFSNYPQYLDQFTFLPPCDFFTFLYSFFSSTHLLLSLTVAWTSLFVVVFIRDINTLKCLNTRNMKIHKNKEFCLNIMLVAGWIIPSHFLSSEQENLE